MTDTPPPIKKILATEGRASLKKKKFERQLEGVGSRGELWISEAGKPAFITYVGPPYGEYFSAESLANALLLVED